MRKKRSEQNGEKRKMWVGIYQALLLGGVFLALSVVLGRLTSGIIKLFFDLGEDTLLFNICQSIILAVLVIFWQRKVEKLNWRMMGFRRLKPREIILSVCCGGLICLLLLLLALAEQCFAEQMTVQALVRAAEEASTRSMIIKICFLSIIVAPISEEIMFRGFIYRKLKDATDERWGIIITSVLFGVLHFDLYRLFSLILAAVGLNILRERYDSLYASMLAHSVWNALMLGLVFCF